MTALEMSGGLLALKLIQIAMMKTPTFSRKVSNYDHKLSKPVILILSYCIVM